MLRFCFGIAAVLSGVWFGSTLEIQDPLGQEPTVTAVTFLSEKGVPFLETDPSTVLVRERAKLKEVHALSPGEQQPLVLGLVLDRSGSRREQLPDAENEPLKNFATSLLRPTDRVFLHFYSNRQIGSTETATGSGEVSEWINRLASNGNQGYSLLYDAMNQAIERAKREPGRRVLVVVSDGLDNASRLQLEELIEAAQRGGVVVHFVQVEDPQMHPVARRRAGQVGNLAEATGGAALKVRRATDFAPALERIASLVKNQTLVHHSCEADKSGKPRSLKIGSNRKKVKVLYPKASSCTAG